MNIFYYIVSALTFISSLLVGGLGIMKFSLLLVIIGAILFFISLISSSKAEDDVKGQLNEGEKK